tara:strand:- start:859 stop:2208 length:1350 start_codon:yes stop_codon:yes gene_type:complete
MSTTDKILGSREDQFPCYDGRRCYTLTNAKTGKIEVKEATWFGSVNDRYLGYIDDQGTFHQEGRGTEAETKWIRENHQQVINHSVTSSEEDLYENNNPHYGEPPGTTKGNLTKSENALANEENFKKNHSTSTEGFRETDEGKKAANFERQVEGRKQTIGRKKYGNHCYPITLRRSSQDRLRISVLEFMPKEFDKKNFGFAARGASTTADGKNIIKGRKHLGSVTLPVNQVTDANATKWGEDRMNAGQAALADIALAGLEDGMRDLAGVAGDYGKSGAENPALKEAAKQYFVGAATGVKGILARTTGEVINPNLELIFGGPQLRPFTFTYLLSPRDNKESQEILSIIRLFKQSMAPQTSGSNLFLKAPNTYKLEFLTQGSAGSPHRFLPKIKECALLSCNVNYTPNGTYMTYEDSSMVTYQMTLAFQELDPIYNADYGNLDGGTDTDIGF